VGKRSSPPTEDEGYLGTKWGKGLKKASSREKDRVKIVSRKRESLEEEKQKATMISCSRSKREGPDL